MVFNLGASLVITMVKDYFTPGVHNPLQGATVSSIDSSLAVLDHGSVSCKFCTTNGSTIDLSIKVLYDLCIPKNLLCQQQTF